MINTLYTIYRVLYIIYARINIIYQLFKPITFAPE